MPLCFLDFETTGSNLFKDDPIQIGAVLYENSNGIVKEFSSLISPSDGVRNTEKAYRIHGIGINSLRRVPSQNEVLKRFFLDFGHDYSFAGWNISFDIPFFKKMCFNNNYQTEFDKINYRHLDVQSICQILKNLKLVDNNLSSLDDFTSYFNINRKEKHDALEDSRITCELYCKVMAVLKERISYSTLI